MKCVIIAAGKGERLQEKGTSKPLVNFLGLPLIERTIRTAKKAGANEFFVVTGHEKDPLSCRARFPVCRRGAGGRARTCGPADDQFRAAD